MKNKKSKNHTGALIVFLFIFMYILFAPALNIEFDQRILFEIIVTGAIAVGVFKPLSFIISPAYQKRTYWTLFIARIILLLLLNPIVKDIHIYDFLSVFIGVFIVVPIARLITKNRNPISKINVDNISSKVSDMIKDESPIVETNYAFMQNENKILKKIILKEINLQGKKNILIKEAVNRQNIIILLFIVFTFICIAMFFFNIDIKICLGVQTVLILLFIYTYQSANTINMLARKAIKNPNENISSIVNNARLSRTYIVIPNFVKLILGLIIVTINVIALFYNPRTLYLKYGEGYMLFKYTRGITYESEVIIPSEYNGLTVTTIGESAFKNSQVKIVKLPNKLESIKTKAFYGASRIEEITIPSTVTEIRGSAFENCTNLKSVNLNEGLLSIRGKAFKNNINLKNIILPKSLEYLGAGAFSKCSSLVEMIIPSKITEINGQTFEYCTSLKQITLHDEIISIHGEVFKGCTSLNNVTLPSKIVEIRGNTFEGCSSLTSITIPEGVTRIGGHAFYGCTQLKSAYIPITVKEIGSSAFRRCSNLNTVKVSRTAYINERAFKESPTIIKYYENNDEVKNDADDTTPLLENKLNTIDPNNKYMYADEYTFKEKDTVLFAKEDDPWGIKLSLNKIIINSNNIQYYFNSDGIIKSDFLLNNYDIRFKNISIFFAIEIISSDNSGSVTVRIYHN